MIAVFAVWLVGAVAFASRARENEELDASMLALCVAWPITLPAGIGMLVLLKHIARRAH
jgi:hypothetical protein